MTRPTQRPLKYTAEGEWAVALAAVMITFAALLVALLLFCFLLHAPEGLTARPASEEITYTISVAAGWIIVSICMCSALILLMLRHVCRELRFCLLALTSRTSELSAVKPRE